MRSHVTVEVLIVGQEAFGVLGGGPGTVAGDELFTDGRDGLELLEVSAVAVQRQGVECRQDAGF